MTWFAVITADGELVSTGTEVADPLPDGLSCVALDGPPADGMTWDPVARAFAPTPVDVLRDRFAEFAADPDVAAALAALDPATVAAVQRAMFTHFGDVRYV